MRVLLVRPTASGGLAAHVDQELALLEAAGHRVAEAPVRIRERPSPRHDAATVATLRRLLRRWAEPVAVHAHGLRAGALAALAVPRRGGHRLVVTLHNRTIGSRAARLVGAALLRLLTRRADVVLAVSPDLAVQARSAGARDVRHAVVPAPARAGVAGVTGAPFGPPRDAVSPGTSERTAAPDTPHARAVAETSPTRPDGERRGPLTALVIARLALQKGLDDLLDAAARLRGASVRILVAGDGPLHDELAARIAAEDLPVELLGRRQDVPDLLAGADLVLSAARWEGQPVALQEALGAGRAIIATDAGGTRWVTGTAAHLVPVGDPAALAEAVLALRDPLERGRCEAASRRRARELPSAEDLLAQLEEVLAPAPRRW
jgi:glycosyltransferase involved in cell wall biosynthesis